jgi:hypothetical protein
VTCTMKENNNAQSNGAAKYEKQLVGAK